MAVASRFASLYRGSDFISQLSLHAKVLVERDIDVVLGVLDGVYLRFEGDLTTAAAFTFASAAATASSFALSSAACGGFGGGFGGDFRLHLRSLPRLGFSVRRGDGFLRVLLPRRARVRETDVDGVINTHRLIATDLFESPSLPAPRIAPPPLRGARARLRRGALLIRKFRFLDNVYERRSRLGRIDDGLRQFGCRLDVGAQNVARSQISQLCLDFGFTRARAGGLEFFQRRGFFLGRSQRHGTIQEL